ncbi:hypothetical protein [Stenotrophomonas sp. 1337]|uniref:hypothetical protein n=1 Tax=Stenotrophomonas sp. 1337 TaxID=2817757 RepID=UPI00285B5C43|nr:hypothetical protein [Stenotrophomonas sp. 1337]MDR6694029.1 hypothetical protein [Stenotrophomonas sp. 1337]
MPYPSRVFGLPKTHVLTLHQSTNPLDLEFVVWCLAFFLGMPLTTTEAGFLDAAPTKPGKLVDFGLTRPGDEGDAIGLALGFLNAEPGDSRAPKRVAAVIHALFLSQYPQSLPFEGFQYFYMALDGCFQLISAKGGIERPRSHGERIQWMCAMFDMPVPDWARHATSVALGCSEQRLPRGALLWRAAWILDLWWQSAGSRSWQHAAPDAGVSQPALGRNPW